jgi:hypothetical protein
MLQSGSVGADYVVMGSTTVVAIAISAFVLTTPVAILVHELGHAWVGTRLSKRPVQIVIGRPTAQIRFRLGRTTVRFGLLPTRGVGWSGVAIGAMTPDRPGVNLAVTLAGPAAIGAWAVGFIIAGLLCRPAALEAVLLLIGTLSLVAIVPNLVPVERPAWLPERTVALNDGQQALRAWRELRAQRRDRRFTTLRQLKDERQQVVQERWGLTTPDGCEALAWPVRWPRICRTPEASQRLLDKVILVVNTPVGAEADPDARDTYHGVIEVLDEQLGIGVRRADTGALVWLPPDLRAFVKAPPGRFRHRASGETVAPS